MYYATVNTLLFEYHNTYMIIMYSHMSKIFSFVKPGIQTGGWHILSFMFCKFSCVCPPPRLLIISGMMYPDNYEWLNRFYSFYMAAVASIVSRCGLSIDASIINKKTNKSKLALYMLLLLRFKQL